MKKNKITTLALLACLSISGAAQNTDKDTATGFVLDKWGKPVYGAWVNIEGTDGPGVSTDRSGKFVLPVAGASHLQITYGTDAQKIVPVETGKPMTVVMDYAAQTIDVGANRNFNRETSTASVSTVYNEDFSKRSSKDINNALLGQGTGLISLQNAGNYAAIEPTFYIRGLQSLSGSTPLILVDGLERDATQITPEEVSSVSILKDAAAVAMYGYKGQNGAILITTKRGSYSAREVKFTYDHLINWMYRKPKFADAFTYASALNEARTNDGYDPTYTGDELNAFRTGLYPYLYPNVDWMNEVFRDKGVTNKYTIEFKGGTKRLRYYTMVNLLTDKGFIDNARANDGYSTQNMYSKANLRTNLDVDLTSTTLLKINLLGTLAESRRPGASTNLWDLIYTVPSAAFPIKNEDGLWGGSVTWDGTKNPVGQAINAAYSKGHTRSLLADMTINQDLSSLLQGLSATARISYDNYSSIWEDHSKSYTYGKYAATWTDGVPEKGALVGNGGKDTAMGTGASTNAWSRQFNFSGGFNYENNFGKHNVYSQLKWEYEYRDTYGLNTTIYRQNVSWFTHYGFNDRYFAELALIGSASSKLAPEHKWSFSPTLSAAWVLSKENFLKDVSWINFLKLRASAGVINADHTPNGIADYWDQLYTLTGVVYPFTNSYESDFGATDLARLASLNSTHEKAYKYNAGLEATLFNGLNISFDAFYQHRADIWVTANNYSTVLGQSAPYVNGGIVNSWGYELGLDYTKKFGDVTIHAGGSLVQSRNKIVEELEEPKLYDNLKQTGKPLNQIFGLEAIGFFKDQADIDNSAPQTLGSTVKPGDIKYRDINGDGVIDENDQTAIGYNLSCPEFYYTFNLGAEWKGFGFSAMFQGVGRYSAMLNTKSMFAPLVGNTTISYEYYDNRWTPDHQDAKYPRLSSESNKNNYRNNTLWLADRSFLKLRNVELYYNLPEKWLQKTRFMNRAKVYVRGIDLLCFDHIKVADPESYGATNPMTRSLVVGLTVGF